MPTRPKPPIERFLPKVDKECVQGYYDASGQWSTCWEWIGHIDKTTGYGKFLFNGGVNGAHRFSYEYYIGLIPEGLFLDHLCKHRWCVRPEHLEPVTLMQNLLRGDRSHLGKHLREKTHCPQGHSYSPENTWINPKNGARYCKACNRERMRERRALS